MQNCIEDTIHMLRNFFISKGQPSLEVSTDVEAVRKLK